MSYATALLFQQHSLKSTLELLQMEKNVCQLQELVAKNHSLYLP